MKWPELLGGDLHMLELSDAGTISVKSGYPHLPLDQPKYTRDICQSVDRFEEAKLD
jgi:hypothetical protein